MYVYDFMMPYKSYIYLVPDLWYFKSYMVYAEFLPDENKDLSRGRI